MRTVGGVLGEAIAKVLRHDVELTCAGRTDAGVHAWGQVVSFASSRPSPTSCGCSRRSTRCSARRWWCGRARSPIRSSTPGTARSRRAYRYSVLNRPVTDPFRDRFVWWVPEPLDLRVLRLAADPFVGEHDFTAFCRKGPEGSSLTRRVFESRWVDEGDGALRYEIRANAFCWQMVRADRRARSWRSGRAGSRPGDIMGVLRGRDRQAAGQLAPPRGLCLWDVGY